MSSELINGVEVSGMVEHWLKTPPNAYLGSSYGSDPYSLLQRPNTAGLADQFTDKMINDVPVLSVVPSSALNVLYEDVDKETKNLIIQVFDSLVRVDESRVIG